MKTGISARQSIKTVVIPAAGLGTRFHPYTKYIPKEMISIGSVPVIAFAIQEAMESGAEEIIVVINESKSVLVKYLSNEFPGLNISFVYQGSSIGLGAAILCCEPVVKDRLFGVILPDVIRAHYGGIPPLVEMKARSSLGGATILTQKVPRSDVSKYGIVEGFKHKDFVKVTRLYEKPSPEDTISRHAIVGRYLLPPSIFKHLRMTIPSINDELQLTDALDLMAEKSTIRAVSINESLHDVGTPEGLGQFYLTLADTSHS